MHAGILQPTQVGILHSYVLVLSPYPPPPVGFWLLLASLPPWSCPLSTVHLCSIHGYVLLTTLLLYLLVCLYLHRNFLRDLRNTSFKTRIYGVLRYIS